MKKLFAALFTAMVMTLGFALAGAPATAATPYPPVTIQVEPGQSGKTITLTLPVNAKGALTVAFKKKGLKCSVTKSAAVDGGPETVKVPRKKIKKNCGNGKFKTKLVYTPAPSAPFGPATTKTLVKVKK